MIGAEDADGLKAYMREIWCLPLITVEEEILLAAKIKKGDDKAREQMIRANLRLVVKIAYEYVNYGLPLIDLIAEGNVGLMKAADRFNPAKKCKFSTYAAWWIKQAIKRALANQSKIIRLPVHLVDKVARIRKASQRMFEETGVEPTDDEIAAEVGLSVYKVTAAKQAAVRPISLDSTVQLLHGEKEPDLEARKMYDIVADESMPSPFEALAKSDLQSMALSLLKILDRRERTILTARFGLSGGKPKTLEVVGVKMGITRERVRQIQNEALVKLKEALAEKENYFAPEEI